MSYLCSKCGNTDRFMQFANVTEWTVEEHILDGDGEIITYGDSEIIDSEFTGYRAEMTCMNCSFTSCSVEVDDADFPVIDAILDFTNKIHKKIFMAHHTDKNGNWHRKELKFPNKRLMLEAGSEAI